MNNEIAVRRALARLESAVDWHLGRSGFTQSTQLKGVEHGANVRKELYAAHDAARAALAHQPPAAVQAKREPLTGWHTLQCKPLTDDDIEAIASSIRPITETGEPSWEHAIARAIERAHGIGAAGEGAEQ